MCFCMIWPVTGTAGTCFDVPWALLRVSDLFSDSACSVTAPVNRDSCSLLTEVRPLTHESPVTLSGGLPRITGPAEINEVQLQVGGFEKHRSCIY